MNMMDKLIASLSKLEWEISDRDELVSRTSGNTFYVSSTGRLQLWHKANLLVEFEDVPEARKLFVEQAPILRDKAMAAALELLP